MYSVTCDGSLLLNKLSPIYTLHDPILHLEANEAGSFEFDIYDNHPNFNIVNLIASKIKIYKKGSLYWLGRAKQKTNESKREKHYYCEGCIAYLKDSLVPPYDFSGSPEEFFRMVINGHNSVVSDDQKFEIGTCTATDPNDYIVRSSINYDSAYNIIKEKLIDHYGGYLYVTFDQDERPVLNYYIESPYTCNQFVEFGENLISYEEEIFYDEMYTACVPLGAKVQQTVEEEDGESRVIEKRLTIGSINDGLDYLLNDELVASYGIRFAPTSLTTWDDVTVATNLKTKGENWLQESGSKHKETVTLDAVDISTIKQGLSSFEFLWNIGFKSSRVVDPVFYILSDLYIDLNLGANVSITLGDTKSVYTGVVSQAVANVSNRVDTIAADYTTKQEAHQVAETVIETTTRIQTEAARIISEVMEEYRTSIESSGALYNDIKELKSQIEQLSNQVTTSFTYYNQVGDSVKQIQSWVTIIPQTETQNVGIIISHSDSAVKIKVQNDKIYFYTGDDDDPNILMWQDSETLHIDRVEIQSLIVGEQGKQLVYKIVGTGANTSVAFVGRLVL